MKESLVILKNVGGLGEGNGPGLDQVFVLKFSFKKCFFFFWTRLRARWKYSSLGETNRFIRNKLFAPDVSDANEMKSFIDLLNDVKRRHLELYFVYRTL